MTKYKVFDQDGKFLGHIFGRDSEEALEEAKLFGMQKAAFLEKVYTLEKSNVYPFRRPKKKWGPYSC